jgi:hypothetical protein
MPQCFPSIPSLHSVMRATFALYIYSNLKQQGGAMATAAIQT